MSEIIAEKPSTYNTTNNTAAELARRLIFECGGWTASRNSYDVTDNKTNEVYLPQWKCEQFTMDEKYQREDERLNSFENWPLEWLNKRELAQIGLVYTGEDDKVKCYFCEVEIGRWERDDQPINEHLRFSPNCPLLRRRTTNNVPISNDTLSRVLPPVSYDVCGNEGYEFEANDVSGDIAPTPQAPLTTGAYQYDSIAADNLSNHHHANANSSSSSANNSRCGNEAQLYRPEYPEYAIEAARLRSFAEWPRNMKQRPKELADAGFFYTGTGDRVKCFSCGCGLKDWDDDDEPWEQHALWLPKCRYLNLLKGQSYIESVAAKYKTNNSKCPDAVPAESDQYCPTSDNIVVQPVIATAALTPTTSKTAEAATTAVKTTAVAATIAEEKLCKICYADEYNTAFLPCGHVVACAKCASSVSKCPVCRKPFTNVMRVFFP
ncbi:death-associated inhibitor of apoptosis 1 [Bactrocera tryoni]|uniref:death-associated inhibitor of apoptosis 1 n=1 Tax=Bactrocera tryoni TaxID=59916 RepID=UPI001A980D0E|nr:death-associated inhibitor of apoptosis 1 [Bactrocera tryoni]XP_039967146.1 death-associated inhibitor of apoptosis 1 [Bactrocera tryoni]XP_039967147.1 death-associated inhibitor of apoptosis 1 [Bactrocera tryoni]XP_039967148.1 death-associated inhibitor of apoptosis 1 [Bactrocera tryoni]XP_039967149.1 death-associated inhibitor of apoptosis 1 [Bactrocera tryoni]XP_039967150.1 death-associated inhibitor of apoptosis 1 [Bactrocera tryoni]